MFDNLDATAATAGSTVGTPLAHAAWLGHPSQELAFPASAVPDTHVSFAFFGRSLMVFFF
jgi:hypothetical protein